MLSAVGRPAPRDRVAHGVDKLGTAASAGYPRCVADQNDDIRTKLNRYLEPDAQLQATPEESQTYEVDLTQLPPEIAQQVASLPPGATIEWTQITGSAEDAQEVELDDESIELAQQAARPAWYESGWTGLVVLGAPLLAIMSGAFGGGGVLIILGALVYIVLALSSCFGVVLGLLWVLYFFSYRSRVADLRRAVRTRRAWSIAGPLSFIGNSQVLVSGMYLVSVRPIRLPDLNANYSTLFARGSQPGSKGSLIAIRDPQGRLLYPETGVIPTILKGWALAVSLLISIGLTATCNSQANIYSDAATHLNEIKVAAPCTQKTKAADPCSKWTDGTVLFEQNAPSTDFSFFSTEVSTCRVTLRWPNTTQVGDIRADGADCAINIKRGVLTPAHIELVRNYAIEADVAGIAYRTDHWPPLGDGAFTLAIIARLVSIAWLAWPFVHIMAALYYRVRRRQAGTPAGEQVNAAR